jgi:hypothetical protein
MGDVVLDANVLVGYLEAKWNAAQCSEMHRKPLQVVADPVAAELEAALALRRPGADPKTLRRALRRIEELLDG